MLWYSFHLVKVQGRPGSRQCGDVECGDKVFQLIRIGARVGYEIGVSAGWNCSTAVNFPSGPGGNGGENITFQGGSIFSELRVGFRNNGGELNIDGMSIDGLSDAAIINLNGAVRVYNTHIEYFAPIKTSPLEIEGGCNAWTFIDLSGGLIQSDTGITNVRSTIDIEAFQYLRRFWPVGKSAEGFLRRTQS